MAFNEVLAKGFEGHHFINGLASHFRDLLVAKDGATVQLLEVGDNTKKKYLEQATKASLQFLLPAIDKANDCDLKYRASKNQRLLVELTLMQIASITFDGAKKKSSNYIIPATFFTSLLPKVKKEIKTAPIQQKTVEKVTEVQEEITIKKPRLEGVRRRSSSLTLKSVHEKKEERETDLEENFDNHPKTPFTQEQLKEVWKKYYFKLYNGGERSVASVITAGEPQLTNNFEILFSLPNSLMANQLERAKPKLLKHLRESLNNYGLSIKVIINETVEKKFAYTPQEKYEKLKEKNPLLEKLKNTFGLDV